MENNEGNNGCGTLLGIFWAIIIIIAVITTAIDDANYDLDDWDLPEGHNAFTHRHTYGQIVNYDWSL